MWILLIYLLGLAVLTLLLRKQRGRVRSVLIVVYNYLFVVPSSRISTGRWCGTSPTSCCWPEI